MKYRFLTVFVVVATLFCWGLSCYLLLLLLVFFSFSRFVVVVAVIAAAETHFTFVSYGLKMQQIHSMGIHFSLIFEKGDGTNTDENKLIARVCVCVLSYHMRKLYWDFIYSALHRLQFLFFSLFCFRRLSVSICNLSF